MTVCYSPLLMAIRVPYTPLYRLYRPPMVSPTRLRADRGWQVVLPPMYLSIYLSFHNKQAILVSLSPHIHAYLPDVPKHFTLPDIHHLMCCLSHSSLTEHQTVKGHPYPSKFCCKVLEFPSDGSIL